MVIRRQRVAIYVVRTSDNGLELLVFDHVDAPEAGTQIPAGGIDSGEELVNATIREVREETGLEDIREIEILGTQDLLHPEVGVPRFTTFLRATTNTVQSGWDHRVFGEGDDSGMNFRCYFVPIEVAQDVLHWEQAEFLDRLV